MSWIDREGDDEDVTDRMQIEPFVRVLERKIGCDPKKFEKLNMVLSGGGDHGGVFSVGALRALSLEKIIGVLGAADIGGNFIDSLQSCLRYAGEEVFKFFPAKTMEQLAGGHGDEGPRGRFTTELSFAPFPGEPAPCTLPNRTSVNQPATPLLMLMLTLPSSQVSSQKGSS